MACREKVVSAAKVVSVTGSGVLFRWEVYCVVSAAVRGRVER